MVATHETNGVDAAAGDNFGYPVAMAGPLLVVGATGGGAAYIYRNNGQSWQFEQKLQSSFLTNSVGSLAVDGDTIAFGVPGFNTSSNNSIGAVIVYRFNGSSWIEETVLYGHASEEYFGLHLALDGNRLAVTGPGYSVHGAIFLYERIGANWLAGDILTSPYASSSDFMLYSLAMENDTILSSSPSFPCSTGNGCGIVYVFRENNGLWSLMATIRGTQSRPGEGFGGSISLSAGRFVVGAAGAYRNINDWSPSGACYPFDMASLGCDCDFASCSIDLEVTSDCDGNTRLDDCEIEGRDCNGNQRHDACDVNLGGSTDSDNDGIPDECDCLLVAPVTTESPGLDKSRFISFVPGNPGHDKAIRVKLKSLHHVEPPYTSGATMPFTAFEGEVRWVGPPTSSIESTSNATPFFAAQLQCTPHFRNWGTLDILHVTGSAIVPSSEYEVQIVGANCDLGQENSYSAPLVLRTTRWGDVETPYSPPSTSAQPDVGDLTALVSKFRSAPNAPIKARAFLSGNDAFGNFTTLHLNFGFTHIAACVDAFRGNPYPHTISACP